MQRAAEERKALIAAANQKKNAKGKGKKGKEEAPKVEEEDVKHDVVKPAKEEKKDLDLTNPNDFSEALKEKAPRRFTFGPIDFSDLSLSEEQLPFDHEKARADIISRAEASMEEPFICIHGYKVQIKGRTFKRRTTMLKHGRFLSNLVVSPIYPQPLFQDDEEEGEEGEENQDEDDE